MDTNIQRMLYQEHTPSVNVYLAYCFLVAALAGSFFTQVIDPISIMDLLLIVALPFLVLLPFQLCTQGTLPSYAYLAHACVGIGWGIGFYAPGMSYFAAPAEAPAVFFDVIPTYIGYYALGLFLFAALATGHFWLQRQFSYGKILARLFTLIDLVLLLPPVGQLFYYAFAMHHLSLPSAFYTVAPSWKTMYAIALTDTGEFHMAIYALALAIVTAIFYWANCRMLQRTQIQRGASWIVFLYAAYLMGVGTLMGSLH